MRFSHPTGCIYIPDQQSHDLCARSSDDVRVWQRIAMDIIGRPVMFVWRPLCKVAC
ncbi:hypothetical protein PILCRDRAFT_817306 [Piloderma croceum F 1598]|uniref:Uncharacterized protein n=1 Tax=Piloderma croceum (strain F 1598) TaxID=765440 RepID=A0A0C3FZX1_PILCF|nr:hypothetical protein PILCRDRAFT_817306 [Piloderma croceum F 1598]